LVAIGMESELYHTPDGKPYARTAVNGHMEDWPTNSKAFRDSLAHAFYRQYSSTPNAQAIKDAITTLDGYARFEGAEHVVDVRVAGDDQCVYLDLANLKREVIEITPLGWKVLSQSPVRFWRPAGMLPLPTPVTGGTWDAIKPFINVADDSDYCLILSWCVCAMRNNRPFTILDFLGEHGSAKTTAARVARKLIDPFTAGVRALPRSERDLVIAASRCRVLAFDNVSRIDDWLSDAFCRLATGGGLSTRALHTDAEEVLFDVMRPIVMNGIEQAVWRPDLLDRCLMVETKVIDDGTRQSEAIFWGDFDKAWPELLGVVLNGVSAGLKNLKTTQAAMTKKPRMADFAIFSTAAEVGLGFEAGTFEKAYKENRGVAVESTLEAYPISPFLMKLGYADGSFSGTFTELLTKLNFLQGEDRKPKYWPDSTRKLSADIKRLAPTLRAKGISCTFSEPDLHTKRRSVTLCKMPGNTSATSATSAITPQVVENTQRSAPDVSPSATSETSAGTSETSAETPAAQTADVSPPSSSAKSARTSAVQVFESNQSADVADVADVFPAHSRKDDGSNEPEGRPGWIIEEL
jgi:hypothetical protein